MHRIIALLFTLLCLAAIAGCGRGPESPAEVKTRLERERVEHIQYLKETDRKSVGLW